MNESPKEFRYSAQYCRIPIGGQKKTVKEVKQMLDGLAKKQEGYATIDVAIWCTASWYEKGKYQEYHYLKEVRVDDKWIDLTTLKDEKT